MNSTSDKSGVSSKKATHNLRCNAREAAFEELLLLPLLEATEIGADTRLAGVAAFVTFAGIEAVLATRRGSDGAGGSSGLNSRAELALTALLLEDDPVEAVLDRSSIVVLVGSKSSSSGLDQSGSLE